MSPDSEVLLSSRSLKARIASSALAAVAITAIAVAAAIGWMGIPPERAAAAVDFAAEQGSLDETVPPASLDETVTQSFASLVETAVPLSAQERILAPSERRVTVRKRRVSKARALKGGPWRTARVSWYGPGFYGHTMAGGGRLRRDSVVVAHRSMKFGTKILLRYGGRQVIAVVRDRGPYIGGRTFDLGPGTAKALRFSGVGAVRYRVL